MSVKRRRSNRERAEDTRGRLLAAARRLFAERGYAAVGVDEAARAAGCTKGALYHHFRDKRELFRAVVEDLEGGILDRLRAAAATAGDPAGRLRAACEAYLDACVDPAVGRIVVLDAPGVLGWEAWCALDRAYGLGFFADLLRAARPEDPGAASAAQMLLGALNVAGRVIAQAEDRRAARRQVGGTIERVLGGIAGEPR